MAINSPRIAAGPTKPRGHVLDQRIVTHPVGPGESYNSVASGTLETITVSAPEREGQVFFHVTRFEGDRSASMYVGVNTGSSLVWAPVLVNAVVSSYTGLPYDPITNS